MNSDPTTLLKKPSVSFVIPCLNEEKTLPGVLDTINSLLTSDLSDLQCEVIVSDNGSTDNSISVAQSKGAKVIHCQERGYGAALKAGIASAQNEIVIFADGDGTYDFHEAPVLIERLVEGNYDLVVGTRMRGTIKPGAMPLLHRYLGTPVLTFILNLLHARNGISVSDCNSGFRCFKREAFLGWEVEGNGMEFASEMLIRALKTGAAYSEVPITLSPDVGPRVPHLKTWRDGMRHLLQILLESPAFFQSVGAVIVFLSWISMIVGAIAGPFMVGFVSIFGIQTMLFALLGSLYGIVLWSVGLYLVARNRAQLRIYQYFIDLEEDKLFWGALGVAIIAALMFSMIFLRWWHNDFIFLALEKETVLLIALGSNALLFLSNVLTAHLIKRA